MKLFFNTVFPKTFSNEFKGNKIALYVFYVMTTITLWRSQHHLFSKDGGAQSIATIPLNVFTNEGAQTVISIFSLWGLSQLIIGFIYLLAAVRYKAMIPLLYLLMAFEYIIRGTYIAWYKPIYSTGTAPGAAINFPFAIFAILMLVLCLVGCKKGKKIHSTPTQ